MSTNNEFNKKLAAHLVAKKGVIAEYSPYADGDTEGGFVGEVDFCFDTLLAEIDAFSRSFAAPAQAEPSDALSGSFEIAVEGSRIAFDGEEWTLPATYRQLVPVAQELARRCAYAKQAIEARGALSDAEILNLSEDFKRNYHACGADVEEFDALGFAKALLGILGQPLFSDKKLD